MFRRTKTTTRISFELRSLPCSSARAAADKQGGDPCWLFSACARLHAVNKTLAEPVEFCGLRATAQPTDGIISALRANGTTANPKP